MKVEKMGVRFFGGGERWGGYLAFCMYDLIFVCQVGIRPGGDGGEFCLSYLEKVL